jgi:hypothetical protein
MHADLIAYLRQSKWGLPSSAITEERKKRFRVKYRTAYLSQWSSSVVCNNTNGETHDKKFISTITRRFPTLRFSSELGCGRARESHFTERHNCIAICYTVLSTAAFAMTWQIYYKIFGNRQTLQISLTLNRTVT